MTFLLLGACGLPTLPALPPDEPEEVQDSVSEELPEAEDSEAEDSETEADSEAPEPPERHSADSAPAPDTLPGQPDCDGDWLFSGEVHPIQLVVPQDSWSALQRSPRSYAAVQLDLGEVQLDVGMKLKGGSTYRGLTSKPSLKVKLDWVAPDLKYCGQNKLTLNNMIYDPSMMAESISYEIFRHWGAPAPRVGYAWVRLNDQDYGLYSIVETPDDPFFDEWFSDSNGNLYEAEAENWPCDLTTCDCYDLEEDDEGDPRIIEELCSLTSLQGEEWSARLQELMDAERWITFLALEIYLAHWDSYSLNLNNYRFYHDPQTDLWTILPWSTDLSFGWYPWVTNGCGYRGGNPNDYRWGVLANSCHGNEWCLGALKTRLGELIEWGEQQDFGEWMRARAEVIEGYVTSDPRREYGNSDYFQHQACIQGFMEGRRDSLALWLEDPP